MSENIIVYGDFTLPLNKYPRKGTNKEQTDIIVILFLMHEEFLTKCAKSIEDAIRYFNGCKEYYYNYETPDGVIKRYNAKEIIQMNTLLTNRRIRTAAEYYQFIKNFAYVDQIYLSYLRSRDFYMNLYQAIRNAKDAHFERRDFFYKISPPMELFGHRERPITSQLYNAYELMELFTYTYYLKKHRIIKELPIPSFMETLQEESRNSHMTRLYQPNLSSPPEEEESGDDDERRAQPKLKLILRNSSLSGDSSPIVSRNSLTDTSLWDHNSQHILN